MPLCIKGPNAGKNPLQKPKYLISRSDADIILAQSMSKDRHANSCLLDEKAVKRKLMFLTK